MKDFFTSFFWFVLASTFILSIDAVARKDGVLLNSRTKSWIIYFGFYLFYSGNRIMK